MSYFAKFRLYSLVMISLPLFVCFVYDDYMTCVLYVSRW